jgi:hypothetical protein
MMVTEGSMVRAGRTFEAGTPATQGVLAVSATSAVVSRKSFAAPLRNMDIGCPPALGRIADDGSGCNRG